MPWLRMSAMCAMAVMATCRSRSRWAIVLKSRCAPHEAQGTPKTVVSDVECEKPSQYEAHHEHRPVCEIQTEKSTVVRDTRLHGTLYVTLLKITNAVRTNREVGA